MEKNIMKFFDVVKHVVINEMKIVERQTFKRSKLIDEVKKWCRSNQNKITTKEFESTTPNQVDLMTGNALHKRESRTIDKCFFWCTGGNGKNSILRLRESTDTDLILKKNHTSKMDNAKINANEDSRRACEDNNRFEFSEKDIVDMILSDPEKYLQESNIKLIAQEHRIGSRRFDLLFEDKYGQKLIVEIQKGTLDRDHKNRILDYKAALNVDSPTEFVDMCIVANNIKVDDKGVLKHHGIKYIEIHPVDINNFLRGKTLCGSSGLVMSYSK